MAILLLLAFGFVAYTGWRAITQPEGAQTVISGGTTIQKPSNSVKDAKITNDGYLIIQYEDGAERKVGYLGGLQGATGPAGESGASGRAPTQAEIAFAVVNYCGDGRCDAKNPSSEQVATAVYNYCGAGTCKGADGANGANATADMVMAAVTQYCADGRCVGPQGVQGIAGANGINGRTAVMACVVRTTNNIATQYVAWKYEDEADAAYRDLYKLPTWAQGSSCVDLRST